MTLNWHRLANQQSTLKSTKTRKGIMAMDVSLTCSLSPYKLVFHMDFQGVIWACRCHIFKNILNNTHMTLVLMNEYTWYNVFFQLGFQPSICCLINYQLVLLPPSMWSLFGFNIEIVGMVLRYTLYTNNNYCWTMY
jgi:hypothetical protein